MSKTAIYIVYVETPTGNYYVEEFVQWGSDVMAETWTTKRKLAGRMDYDTAAALHEDFRQGYMADVIRIDTGGTLLLHPERVAKTDVVGHWDGA